MSTENLRKGSGKKMNGKKGKPSMNESRLQFIMQEGEGLKIEFKHSFDKSLAKEIVAFANAKGGKIFLGVGDNSEAVGIKATNRLKSQIQDIANNCDPAIEIDLERHGNILIVEAKEGKDKPYKCKEGFFIRIGPNSQKMKRNKIIELATSKGKIRFDEKINKEFDFKKDFDKGKFKMFLKENNLFTGLETKDILASLGLASREKKKLFLNNAGILFFAKNPQKFFLHSYLDCILFKGKDKSKVIDRKTFRSDLLGQLSSAKEFVKKHLNLGYEFEGFERKEEYEIPLRAIEEALVNALMHRDYFFKGANISLFIYDDRLEIVSPGGLPNGLDRKNFGRISVRRNQIIADIFSKTPYVEQIGSGIKRMKNLMKKANLSPPKFEMNNFFAVTFKRKKPLIEPLPEPLIEPLPEPSKKIIKFIGRNKKVNRLKIISQIGLSRATATRHLSKLKKKGMIKYLGSKKNGYYILTKRKPKKKLKTVKVAVEK